jgi:hypothetical protein
MYHPHADEMVQMAMGMMGMFIVHPRDPRLHRVDRDFLFIMSTYDIDPGSTMPKVMTMTDFDLWTWNTRVFPGIDPLVVRQGDRVRVRIGNLTMTNHPIHLHGYSFEVTGTDGGWVPQSARLPEVTTDVPVGAMRAFEFTADEPGDWAIHCHKSHHTMNAMGHDVKTLLGARERDLRPAISKVVPNYMAMGGSGMAEMGRMQMQLPDNTLPMMTGFGQYGPLEMGGMFSVVKVREGIARNDYRDPGPYRHPPGSVAHEVEGAVGEPTRRSDNRSTTGTAVEVKVVKPGSNGPMPHH